MAIVLFAFILGIRAFTDEFRYGTVTTSVLVTPRRGRLVAAKILTFAIGGVVLAVVAEAAMVGAASRCPRPRASICLCRAGISGPWAAWCWRRDCGPSSAWVSVPWFVIRSPPWWGAWCGCWWWRTSPRRWVPGLAPFFPGRAATALAQVSGQDLLAPWPGGLVLAAYALIGAGAGWVAFRRGDVGARL